MGFALVFVASALGSTCGLAAVLWFAKRTIDRQYEKVRSSLGLVGAATALSRVPGEFAGLAGIGTISPEQLSEVAGRVDEVPCQRCGAQTLSMSNPWSQRSALCEDCAPRLVIVPCSRCGRELSAPPPVCADCAMPGEINRDPRGGGPT